MTQTQERFTVSSDGLRELNASRQPWHLVKELIQNSWDEAPEATMCDVRIWSQANGTTTLVVTDDGPGFREVSDAWTLMANTPKRADPTKRGRFNLGEKEIVSVAIEATIQTAGHTVQFPKTGGRTTEPNDQKDGTVVILTMPWSKQQADELRRHLLRFRPTDCGLRVDGQAVPSRAPLASRDAPLRTLIQHGPGLPMSDTKRRTTIDILERADPESAWIYEMGIPIQTTTMAFDVDIHQKVPMPPNRDTVSAGYLQDIMAETLNAMYDLMTPNTFSETWVRTGVEDERIEDAAVRAVRHHRYGAEAVMWSSDTDANMRAAEAGYQVIHPRAMSTRERHVMTTTGGLESAKSVFGRPPESQTPENAEGARAAFAEWIAATGRILGLRPKVKFVSAPESQIMAQCSANRRNPTITVNTSLCSDEWLAQRGAEQLELIIHELAHALADTPMEHGPRWGEACASAGARVAHAMSQSVDPTPPKSRSNLESWPETGAVPPRGYTPGNQG